MARLRQEPAEYQEAVIDWSRIRRREPWDSTLSAATEALGFTAGCRVARCAAPSWFCRLRQVYLGARATGLSESRIKILFRYALNLSWVKYLQGYRIHRAAALLCEGRLNVTEAALEVGFDSLSHFNETFHSFMGVSPKSFVRK